MGKKILIVDDEADMSTMLKRHLELPHYEPTGGVLRGITCFSLLNE